MRNNTKEYKQNIIEFLLSRGHRFNDVVRSVDVLDKIFINITKSIYSDLKDVALHDQDARPLGVGAYMCYKFDNAINSKVPLKQMVLSDKFKYTNFTLKIIDNRGLFEKFIYIPNRFMQVAIQDSINSNSFEKIFNRHEESINK